MNATDLIQLHNFYFSQDTWKQHSDAVKKIGTNLEIMNLSDEQWDAELEKGVNNYIATTNLPKNFPLVPLREISQKVSLSSCTKLKADDQRKFVASLTNNSFCYLTEEEQRAALYLLNDLKGVKQFKRKAANS